MQTYIVKKGDTLYGISNQFGVSVIELASLNNIKGDNLQINQELLIPDTSGTNPNTMFFYTVKKGDTLYSIAKKYNTSVSEILKLNYLTDPSLTIGQVLRIPEMYTKEEDMYLPQYTNYIVQKNDTLYSIAKKYNIDVETLKKDNSLTNNNILPGQILKIRTEESTIEESCFGEEYIPSLEDPYQTYTVIKGDTLYSIAKKFNTSVSELLKLNQLSSSSLSIGQVLKIPIKK